MLLINSTRYAAVISVFLRRWACKSRSRHNKTKCCLMTEGQKSTPPKGTLFPYYTRRKELEVDAVKKKVFNLLLARYVLLDQKSRSANDAERGQVHSLTIRRDRRGFCWLYVCVNWPLGPPLLFCPVAVWIHLKTTHHMNYRLRNNNSS